MNRMGVQQPARPRSKPGPQTTMLNGYSSTVAPDDITPRARPCPHQIRAPSAEPTVPEVTIFFDGRSADTSYMDLPPAERAPLADIYGPIHNQRLPNGSSAAARKSNVPVVHKPGVPVQNHNGHGVPVQNRNGHGVPVHNHNGHSVPVQNHNGHSVPLQNHNGHGVPVHSVPVQHQNGQYIHRGVGAPQDEFMTSYPRAEAPYPRPTHAPHPGPPTSQYPAPRTGCPQRNGHPHPDYYPAASHVPAGGRGVAPRTRQAPVPMGHSCIPSTMEYPQHHQQHPRLQPPAAPADPRYGPPQPHQYPGVPLPRPGAPTAYRPAADPSRPAPDYGQHPGQYHPHEAQPQRQPRYYQPAPGPTRLDPAAAGGEMTLAQTMQNLNIRLKPASPGSGSGSDSLNTSSEGGSVVTVNPDVYEVLRMQDAQLQELRGQLAKLLAKQDSQGQGEVAPPRQAVTLSTQTSMYEAPPPRVERERCSVGINTSMLQHGGPSQAAAVQTSPPRCGTRHTVSARNVQKFLSGQPQDPARPRKPSPGHRRKAAKQGSPEAYHPNHSANASPHDRQRLPSNVTSPGDPDHNDSYTLGELQLSQFQSVSESMLSDMVVDLPAYTSLTPQKVSSGDMADSEDSSGSPGLGESVSMYDRAAGQEDTGYGGGTGQEDTGYGESGQEPELVVNYKQLLGNVQRFLAKNSGADESGDTGPDHALNRTLEAEPETGDHRQVSLHSHADSVHSASGGSFHSHHSADVAPPAAPQQQQERSAPSPRQPTPATRHVDQRSADATRRQLEKLGVYLPDSTAASDMSRLDQSLYLETEFLPHVEYESLMLTDDSDLSACADQLAMKYLTDDQLSELAKLKPRRGLGRAANTNTTPLSNPMNHMSFATRKYMERYGLLEGGAPEEGAPPEADLVNVTAFLADLHQTSFVEDTADTTANAQYTLTQSCSGTLPGHAQSSCSASSISGHHGHYYSDGDSHVGVAQRPAENAAAHKMSTPKVPGAQGVQGAPAAGLGASPRLPGDRPFRTLDRSGSSGYNNDIAAAAAAAAPTRQPENAQDRNHTPRVLDIQRLKEMPKLL